VIIAQKLCDFAGSLKRHAPGVRDVMQAEIFGSVAIDPLNPYQGGLSSNSTRTSMPVNSAGGPN
jgi:hypothetical protein